MEELTSKNPNSHQQLAEIYADRIDPEIRIYALRSVLEDFNQILGRDIVRELNKKADNNIHALILDIGCGRMGVGRALQEVGLYEIIKLIGVDINDYGLRPTPPYSEVITGDITSEETLNNLREKFGNEKILAIFGIGLPPEIVKELLEKKSDRLINLLTEEGIILFIFDFNPGLKLKSDEFKLFKGNLPSDQIIIYYQKPTSTKE